MIPGTSSFEFLAPRRILFGEGKASLLAELAGELGMRPAVVTGATVNRHAALLGSLPKHLVIPQSGEPTVADLEAALEKARAFGADVVIGLGGGSALDLAKAIAGLLPNPGDPFDHLEVIGRGLPLPHPALPVIAVPTTAGTGSEATKNAVLGSPTHGVKVSLRHPSMVPAVALVDPELTYGLPQKVWAMTGMDALSQLLEPFLSHRATPLTDALCRSALPLALRALPSLLADPGDRGARRDLSYASLCGGLALANAGLGAVHGIAGPLGGMIPIPHGAACAQLLPPVFAANRRLAQDLAGGDPRRQRFAEAESIIAPGDDAAAALHELVHQLGIAPLGSFGLEPDRLPELVEKAGRSSSIKGNPFPLSNHELMEILAEAL